MRVNQSGNNPVQNGDVANAKKTSKAEGAQKGKKAEKGEGKTTIAGSVNAQISNRGKEMATAKAAAAAAPETREEKIAALKARISAGKYNVDSEAVADRLVDEHISMSGIG